MESRLVSGLLEAMVAASESLSFQPLTDAKQLPKLSDETSLGCALGLSRFLPHGL
jgi:hypothetical protein